MKERVNLRDILLIPFPFADLSGKKIRPCIILAKDRDDAVVVFITSVKPESNFIELKPDILNNLQYRSYIRYSKIASLDLNLRSGKLGEIDAETFKLTKSKIKEFLGL